MRRAGEPPKDGRSAKARESARKRYITAFKKLPDEGDPEKELAWVKVHPKLMEATINGKPVELGIRDITDSPSKAAVVALQHWIHHPKEFHKSQLDATKKAINEKDPESVDDGSEYPEIQDIDELLMSLEGAIRPGGQLEITTGAMQVEFDD